MRRIVPSIGWADLSEDDGVTRLRLTHHGLPPAVIEHHERG